VCNPSSYLLFSLVFFRPSGILFEIENGSEKNTLKDGDIVTIHYDNMTPNAVPVNPKISRVRKDISWMEVKRSHAAQFNGKILDFFILSFTFIFASFLLFGFLSIIRH